MKILKTDICIVGGGIVGLCLAYQISQKRRDLKITIVEKESRVGLHTSGRNSGVVHAGIYYPPNTLKAKVCVNGGKRLLSWCKNEGLPVNKCGKIIVPQRADLDNQLDFLLDRGLKNGAEVYLINEKEFKKLAKFGRTSSGRAIWSPRTSVVNPKLIIERLTKRLKEKGVKFLLGRNIGEISSDQKSLEIISKGLKEYLFFDHLFNTSGLQADRVAHKFGIAKKYKILPFKGIYWKLDPNSGLSFNTNLYPVPDLNIPFLGVHFTPNTEGEISLGPTAIPALGREHYKGIEGIEPKMAFEFLGDLSIQWLKNINGFRNYANKQSLLGIKLLFFNSAKLLVPKLKYNDLLPSNKIGIRAQLYDKEKLQIVDDFVVEKGNHSTHVLNAISPAFTSSFALSDEIIKKATLNL